MIMKMINTMIVVLFVSFRFENYFILFITFYAFFYYFTSISASHRQFLFLIFLLITFECTNFSSSDPHETEVDMILLLTSELYLVAEYDSHLDKIVRFEKVPLMDVTEIELGTYQQTKIFQGVQATHLCLRLNYSVNGVEGYFHMLRSANIRFFNNVAVVIKTPEEILGKFDMNDVE